MKVRLKLSVSQRCGSPFKQRVRVGARSAFASCTLVQSTFLQPCFKKTCHLFSNVLHYFSASIFDLSSKIFLYIMSRSFLDSLICFEDFLKSFVVDASLFWAIVVQLTRPLLVLSSRSMAVIWRSIILITVSLSTSFGIPSRAFGRFGGGKSCWSAMVSFGWFYSNVNMCKVQVLRRAFNIPLNLF